MPAAMPSVPTGQGPLRVVEDDLSSQGAAYAAFGAELKILYRQYFALLERVYSTKIVQGETAQNLQQIHADTKVLESKLDSLCTELSGTLSSYGGEIESADEA